MAPSDDADESDEDEEERFAEFVFGLVDFFGFFFVFTGEGDEVVKEDAEKEQADNSVAAGKDVADGVGEIDVEDEDDEGGRDEK